MKKINWTRAQMIIGEIEAELDSFEEAVAQMITGDIEAELDSFEEAVPYKYCGNVRSCTKNLRKLIDAMYWLCESDYCDSHEPELTGYDEVLEMLPDGSNLSPADMQRLIEHIEQWKRGV